MVLGKLMSHRLSVVVGDLDVVGIGVHEPEADAPLVIDRYGALSFPIAPEGMQSISWRDPQIVQASGQIYVAELAHRTTHDIWRQVARSADIVERPRVLVAKRPNHAQV
jgi:hypothetical protein